MRPPVVLSISSSDPTGTTGVQADLKTFSSLGIHGAAAITVFEDKSGVSAVDARLLRGQIDAAFSQIEIDVIKIGRLSASQVEGVAECLKRWDAGRVVVDPVNAAGDEQLLEALRRDMLPLAELVTPDLEEAEALSARHIETWTEAREAAQEIAGMGAGAVVIKGGRRLSEIVTDLLFDGRDFREYSTERVPGKKLSGVGNAFSAAVAASLAKGETVQHAVAAAKAYVTKGLQNAYELGPQRKSLHFFYRYWQPRHE